MAMTEEEKQERATARKIELMNTKTIKELNEKKLPLIAKRVVTKITELDSPLSPAKQRKFIESEIKEELFQEYLDKHPRYESLKNHVMKHVEKLLKTIGD